MSRLREVVVRFEDHDLIVHCGPDEGGRFGVYSYRRSRPSTDLEARTVITDAAGSPSEHQPVVALATWVPERRERLIAAAHRAYERAGAVA